MKKFIFTAYLYKEEFFNNEHLEYLMDLLAINILIMQISKLHCNSIINFLNE